MKLAESPPGFCSVCYASTPEQRHVDFETLFEGSPILDREAGTIAILPWTGLLASHDALFICEPCIREAAETLAVKPERMSQLDTELKKKTLECDHWKDYAKRIEATLHERPEPGPSAPRRGLRAVS